MNEGTSTNVVILYRAGRGKGINSELMPAEVELDPGHRP